MATKQIVIVEDEIDLYQNYSQALQKAGFSVNGYHTKGDALQGFKKGLPDMVLLDVGLGSDAEAGFDLCRDLRAESKSLPIMFLTALDSDLDMISGLRLGADDYLTKDISMAHLLARVRALFRRVEVFLTTEPKEGLLALGDLLIDEARMQVRWREQSIDLTVTEFWLVHALAKRPGHVRSRDQLMQDANVYVDHNTVTSHIKRIRKKFQNIDPDFGAIDSVYGLGYRWVETT